MLKKKNSADFILVPLSGPPFFQQVWTFVAQATKGPALALELRFLWQAFRFMRFVFRGPQIGYRACCANFDVSGGSRALGIAAGGRLQAV